MSTSDEPYERLALTRQDFEEIGYTTGARNYASTRRVPACDAYSRMVYERTNRFEREGLDYSTGQSLPIMHPSDDLSSSSSEYGFPFPGAEMAIIPGFLGKDVFFPEFHSPMRFGGSSLSRACFIRIFI